MSYMRPGLRRWRWSRGLIRRGRFRWRIGGIIWGVASMSLPFEMEGQDSIVGLMANTGRYQRAYVNYFEDELVRLGYDWKEVVREYLFSGRAPLFNSIFANCTYPFCAGWENEWILMK